MILFIGYRWYIHNTGDHAAGWYESAEGKWKRQFKAAVQKGEDRVIIIKNGGRQIYHPENPNLAVIDPKLTLEDNGAGQLTFKIYKNNLNYGTIRKLYPVLTVIREESFRIKKIFIMENRSKPRENLLS